MGHELTVQEETGYLHIGVSGENSPETVRGYHADVYAACAQQNVSRVLIEENLYGPGLSVLDIYLIVSEGSSRTWPHVRRIAYVDANKEHSSSNMHFAETVAVNRGVNIKVFSSVQEGEKWLRTIPTISDG